MSRIFVFFCVFFSKNFQQVIDICHFMIYNIVINGICRKFVEKRRKKKKCLDRRNAKRYVRYLSVTNIFRLVNGRRK